MEFHSIDFCGTKILTTVTSSAEEVNKWISRIYAIHRQRMSNLILGLDIEWHPFFKPGKRNPVAIIQISVGHRCLIFQLLHASSIPKSLSEFLANPEFTFVGVGVKEDADKLLQDWRLRVGNTVDLAHAAAEKYGVSDYKRKGLKKLAMELIGKCMQKPIHVTLSEWDAKKLSHEQVEYASIDAYVSFELGMSLKKGGYHYDDRYNIDDPIMECHYDPYHPNIDPYNYGHPILMDQLYHYDGTIMDQWCNDIYHYDDLYHYDDQFVNQYFDGPYNSDHYADLTIDHCNGAIDHCNRAIMENRIIFVVF